MPQTQTKTRERRREHKPKPRPTAQHTCRPDQLFGAWIIEPRRFAEALAIVKASPVVPVPPKVNARLLDLDDEEGEYTSDDYGYVLDGAVARFQISGPLTKYPTSYQEIIGGTSMMLVRAGLRHAENNAQVGGIFIEITSPGGTVAGTWALADDIRRIASRKPVHIYATDSLCSGAEWVGSQGGYLSADPTTWIGSIGAKMALYDSSGAYEKQGVIAYDLTNTAGEFKSIGADGVPIPEKHRKEIIRELDDIFDQFVMAVAEGRGMSIDAVKEVADGRVYMAADALTMGLIDRIETFDEALNRIRQVSSDGDSRGRSVRIPKSAGLERNDAMPLNAAQMQAVRRLPGLAEVSEADAPEKLIAAAASAVTLQNSLTARDTEVATVIKERDDLKKLIVAPPDPAVVEARRELFIAKIDTLQETGKINKDRGDQLRKQVGVEAGKGNAALIVKGADGKCIFDDTLALFVDGETIVPTGEVTGAQGAGIDVKKDAKKGEVTPQDDGKAQGEAYAQQQLAQRGFAPAK